MELVTGRVIELCYTKLRKWVKDFLELETKKENDKSMLGGAKAPGYVMALWEDNHAKFKNGDCKTYFNTGRCGKGNQCSWNHDNVLPKNMRTSGKAKGKGGKGYEKGKGNGKIKGWEPKGKDRGKGKGKHGDPKGKGMGKGKRKKGEGMDVKTCNTCSKPGHFSADCWYNTGTKSTGRWEDNQSNQRAQSQGVQPTRGKSPSGQFDRPLCKYIKAGRCQQGANCTYWHPGTCRQWIENVCVLGNKCNFMHEHRKQSQGAGPPQTPPPSGQSRKERRQ